MLKIYDPNKLPDLSHLSMIDVEQILIERVLEILNDEELTRKEQASDVVKVMMEMRKG